MKTFSLKIRFAIVMSIGALALVIGMGAISMHYAREDLLGTLSSQQLGVVVRAGEDLDAKLRLASDTLVASASSIPLDAIASDATFDAFFAQSPAMLQLFDDILIVDATGIVRCDYPNRDGRIGIDLSDRPYVQRAFAQSRPVVSDAMRGKVSNDPLVGIAAPIANADGKTIALMVGLLRLEKSNLLGSLSNARLGDKGYFTVMTASANPIFLAHPDASLLMKKVPRGSDPALAAVLEAKAPGVFVGTLQDGSQALVSYRPLRMTNWIIAAVLPGNEAFAAIDGARDRTVRIALVAAVVALPLVWLFAWLLLRPLSVLRSQVEQIAREPDSTALASVGQHEIGQVAHAFNAMLLDQRRSEALRIASDQDRRRLVAILESSQDFVAMTDTAGHLTYLNASGRLCCGVNLNDDLSHTTLQNYCPPWAIERLIKQGVPAALNDGVWLGESAVLAADGREIPVDHTIIAHRNVDGELEFFSSLLHDTSAAKAASAAMRSSESRMVSIADALPVLVAFIDRDFRYSFVNSRYEEHFAMDRSKMIGKTVAELIGDGAYQAYLPFLREASNGETQVFELESHAGVRPVHFLVKLIPQFDEQKRLTGYHFIHQDITDHKVEHQRLSQLVRADALTGLLNRAGFEAAIDEAMRRCQNHLSAMALFYLDVDRFKAINDQYGHLIGDALLRTFAERLVRAVRSADISARLGGDEFVVIAEGLRNIDDVRSIARKILRAMQPEFEFDGVTLSITASIGVAAYTGAPMAPEELIRRADAALYRAKNAGRNRYDLDDPAQALLPASFDATQAVELTSIF